MLSAVTVGISLDYVEDIKVTPHVYQGQTLAFLAIDGISIHGKNPEMFRRLASRCSEAAAILEAANVPPTVVEISFPLGAAFGDESGVA